MMRARIIVIGVVIVLFVLCMGITAIAYYGTHTLTQPPYPIANRPTPTGTDIAQILPTKVGDFTRGEAGEDGADYSDGQSQVSVAVSIKNSPAQAQASVKAAASIGSGTRAYIIGVDPSFLREISGGNARMLYSRGVYLFDVQTTSGETLDKFMNSFPY